MIQHIAMWHFLEEAGGRSRTENLAIAKDMIEGLAAKIPGIGRFEVGINENAGEQSAHLVLVSQFIDWEALQAYQVHAAHQAVVEFMGGVRDGRWVVDYALDE
jgi:quinol monooxygenase YgiN